MDALPEHPAEEIKRLQRRMNDLVSLLALPAMWTGRDPLQIGRTLLDVLPGILQLDLVYLRLEDPIGQEPVEMAWTSQAPEPMDRPHEVGEALGQCLGADTANSVSRVRSPAGDGDISIVSLQLGLQGEIGIIAAGSRRLDFPEQTERLLLNVAANQAAIGLQSAWLLSEQKRVANELDQRVAQRTRELAAANEDLRRSEAFLAEAQHLSSIGSFSWQVTTDEIRWSAQLYRIFALDPSVPMTLELIATRVHPDDVPMLFDMVDRARCGARNLEYEHRLLMPDRSVKYLHLIAHGTWDRDGRLEYIGAVQDVTERRLADEALSRARSELAHVSRVTSLGALTASIAHEVNQPLAGIITNASTCLRMLAAEPANVEGARETARRTIRDGNRASDVISRLRALFTKKTTAMELVDLNEAAREVIALSMDDLQRNRVIVQPEFDDYLPLVAGDRVQLQQVIQNLLRNAADAMSDVDDRPRRLVISTGQDEGACVRLSVQDAGVGFEPHTAEKLFDAFYTTKSGGMGIGLSISRSIIASHHGRLWAEPNDGPGATFSFTIPCEPECATKYAGTTAPPATTNPAPVVRGS